MLLIHCLLLQPFFVGVLCFVLVLLCSICGLSSLNYIAGEDRAGYLGCLIAVDGSAACE